MTIHIQAFLDSLSIMGIGMLGIFVTTAIIIAVTVALNAAFSKPNK